ncbi:hypothetical protein KU06062604_780006 [Flavobacterium psychrophilum]|uniref:DUF2326 domain-containing protein n=1 Tax=Flavobacterium psychrophilum TaxID=96345 RepID=UPI000B7C1EF2|nr:DUF2326 domain-containing protein [Flavobacterium psychrophilum]SNB22478.1 hypothetical protein KU06062604_780006 [Flavobacterium psychrophilum]
MILEKIYSEPEGLFKATEFRRGVNFIYGRKEINEPKSSLNSIGKTTFLDLIDFCLLSSFQKSHSPRLFSAFDLMTGYNIVLEFTVSNVKYIIKRNVDNNSVVEFGVIGKEISLHKIDEIKQLLATIIFQRQDYVGEFNKKWYRSLIAFYVKIQKFKQAKFLDPIKYISELSEVELNIFHFYLLGLDNTIPFKLLRLRTDEKGLDTSLKEIKKYAEEKYDLRSLKETQNEINRLKVDINKLEIAIKNFELGEQYEDAESEANKLTESIKDNLYQNFLDKEKIKSYQESYSVHEKINLRRISSMYNQISEDLAFNIKKTLKEAVDFRIELSSSRKEFIGIEVEKLKGFITDRDKNIKKFEEKRAKLFYFLSAKEAISDLTEAFYNISDKKNRLSELESNSKILFDLTKELTEIETEINILKNESIDYINSISEEIVHFYENFNNVFDAIYNDNKETSDFSITQNLKKKSLIEIDISLPDMYGKGKNQGRTLIYDLSILLSNIRNTENFPRFLIQDGIFDGVDKAHFISVCGLIDELVLEGFEIQYITTINEEGTLSSEKFGDKTHVAPKYIEENSILTLSPNNKLFKTDF